MDDSKVIETANQQTAVSEPLTIQDADQVAGGIDPSTVNEVFCRASGHNCEELRSGWLGGVTYREERCSRCFKHFYYKNGHEISKKEFEKAWREGTGKNH